LRPRRKAQPAQPPPKPPHVPIDRAESATKHQQKGPASCRLAYPSTPSSNRNLTVHRIATPQYRIRQRAFLAEFKRHFPLRRPTMSSGSLPPQPSPQVGFGFGPHREDDSGLRSRSQRILDKLPSSVSDHLGRRPSRSPDGIGAGLTQAGLVLGSTGSEYLINRSIQQIRDGAAAFLVELNRLASDARSESKRVVRRVNTDIVQGRIHVCAIPIRPWKCKS
jgi:hypothetical protein